MSGWSYAQLVQAIKKANKSVDAEHPDPLLHTMRRAVEPDSFDENGFYEKASKNLRQGRFLLLIVGDEISSDVERMAEFIQRTPHLHFAVGLVEIKLFHEAEDSLDPLFVVPRVVAKTELQTRFVIDITLPGGFQMKSEVKPETQAKETRKTISEELFLKELQKVAPEAADLAS
jgi:hypothetical protein